jgi:hypothetical protein
VGPDVSERQLEQSLLEHLKRFFIELGRGFFFVGSQYPLEIGKQDYCLDLLFYHHHLRCFVIIDLKVEEFKPEFAGKMNFYLAAVDDVLRHPEDRPSIGLILCKSYNRTIVKYALRDANCPMGVATYRLLPKEMKRCLPSPEELRRVVHISGHADLRFSAKGRLRDAGAATAGDVHVEQSGNAGRHVESQRGDNTS